MNTSDAHGPKLESERLSIRSLASEDEGLYCSLYTDPEVMRFIAAPLSKERAIDGFRKTLELMSQPSFERRVVVLIDRSNQQPVGISSVRIVDSKIGRAEVGTLLKPAAHEQGFAWECSTTLITQAFTRPQINELVAYSATDNKISERLLIDLGFTRGDALAASRGRPERTTWSITRDAWTKRNLGAKSKQSKD